MTRLIVLDTETTGLDPLLGHRLVEVGCVELVNYIPSGKTFHHYVNPERDVPPDATRIHGITGEFLKDKPIFAEIVGDFLDFIQNDPLVIHNAAFDMSFLNAELKRCGYESMPVDRAVDTVQIARKKFPGAPANLDALCKRFGIDLSGRNLHGALLDARLLADVYLELIGGKQPGLDMGFGKNFAAAKGAAKNQGASNRPARTFPVPQEELDAHQAMVAGLKDSLWVKG